MILRKTKKGTEDVKLDSEYVYDPNVHISQAEFNQDVLDSIPTGTITENPAYIDDSSSFPVKSIAVKGKTYQIKSTGKNLLDVVENLTIRSFKNLTSNVHISEPGDYIVQCGKIGRGGSSAPYFRYGNNGINLTSNSKQTITISDTSISYYVYANGFNAQSTVTSLINELMIYPANVTDDTYEQYTEGEACPTVNKKSNINNVSGNLLIKKNKKNFFTTDGTYLYKGGSISYSVDGNKITCNSSGSYGFILFDLGLLSSYVGKQLTMKVYSSDIEHFGSTRFISCTKSGGNRTELGNAIDENGVTSLFIGSTNTKDRLAVRLYLSSAEAGVNYIVDKIQVEEGGFATDFENYLGESITFPLSEGQVMYEGDYLADDGVHHINKHIQLDGSETITTDGVLTDVNRYKISNVVTDFKTGTTSLCSHLKFLYNYTQNTQHFYITTGGAIYIFLPNSITSAKEWITENKPEFVYQVNEEIVDPYTEAQQIAWNQIKKLKTYNNITNFSALSDDLNPVVNIVYYKDLNVILDNLNNAILSQGADV